MKSGLIFIDKPKDLTSRDVDFRMMRFCGTKKVGHLGTLDPFATGLLIVAVNQGTKLLSSLTESQKEYEAELFLGIKTNTGDCTGEVIETAIPPKFNEKEILDVLKSLLGKSMQTPPMFSAIKIKGRPLYSYARNNESVKVDQREINITKLKLLEYNSSKNIIRFTATVSKGTYIRTLGETIAERLKTIGHLVSLRRLAVDSIRIDESYVSTIENPKLISIKDSASIFNMPIVLFEDEVFIGQPKSFDSTEEYVLAVDCENKPIAIYHRENNGIYKVQRGFCSE